jgi:hypothetical protein
LVLLWSLLELERAPLGGLLALLAGGLLEPALLGGLLARGLVAPLLLLVELWLLLELLGRLLPNLL